MSIAIARTATVTATVDGSNIAASVGSGALPVFATPSMIALMEKAACACLADVLEPGQTSVGTRISIEHTAASPMGARICAAAEVKTVCGRKVEFAVTAYEGDKKIGEGKHTRVIVDEIKFMAKL